MSEEHGYWRRAETVWSTHPSQARYEVHACREEGLKVVVGSFAIKEDAIRRAAKFWETCYGFTEVRVEKVELL